MTPLRLSALLALILLGSLSAAPALAQAPADWFTDTGSGGTLAQPPTQGPGGGSVAPVGAGPVGQPPGEGKPAAPIARPAQDEPTLGEEELPGPGDAQATEETAAAPADEPAAPAASAAQSDSAGSLPFTGLELAALIGVGLSLVLGGALLWPRGRAAPGQR
ncbi:MAG: hypothetical protein QOH58_1720 [Thermoleophilaceae bacterium]|jgi:hypothetical protein|nr:hypothetical protein [Thermoleophilaceae bacterium]